MTKVNIICEPEYILPEQTYTDIEMVKDKDAINGEYVVFLNSNGNINNTFVETLIAPFKENPKIDLTYCNGTYNSNKKHKIVKNSYYIYGAKTHYKNFCKWMYTTDVILPYFCMVRSDVIRENNTKAFMPWFFLMKKVPCFIQTQEFVYNKRINYPKAANALLIWLKMIKELLIEYREVCDMIGDGKSKTKYKVITLNSYFNKCEDLLKSTLTDCANDGFERFMLRDILKQFEPIVNLSLSDACKVTDRDINNIRIRFNIWFNHVIPYIKSAIQDITIINEIETMLKAVRTD